MTNIPVSESFLSSFREDDYVRQEIQQFDNKFW
jgi:hypothetical protein